MPIFSRQGRNVLFIHIPKTGGTSLERHFSSAGWSTSLREVSRLNNLFWCSPQHYHAEILNDLVRPERFDCVFTVVRDPLSRLRSEYADNMAGKFDPSALAVERWFRKRARQYQADPFIGDNHIRPQNEFILPSAHVMRFEDGLDSVVKSLNNVYDLDLPDTIGRHHDRSTARGGAPSSSVEISGALRNAVVHFYSADYSALGYRTSEPGLGDVA